MSQPYRIIVGTATYDFIPVHPSAPVPSTNIFTLEYDPNRTEGTSLKVASLFSEAGANPTWIALSATGDALLVCNEETDGHLSTFRTDTKTGNILKQASVQKSGASAPCYASFSLDGKLALVANYEPGVIRSFDFDGVALGVMKAELKFEDASFVNKARQSTTHAHCIIPHPKQADLVYVADLGGDCVRVIHLQSDGQLEQRKKVTTPPATGPRQIAFHPTENFLYVVYELTAEIAVYSVDLPTGDLKHLQTLDVKDPASSSVNVTDPPLEYTGAAVRVSDDGKHLYASVRGDSQHESGDCITVCTIDTSSVASHLLPVQYARARKGGWHLRDVALSKDGLYLVTGSMAHGGEVTMFKREKKTGELAFSDRLILKDKENRTISPAGFVWV